MKTTAVVESLSYYKTNVLFQRIPVCFKTENAACSLSVYREVDERRELIGQYVAKKRKAVNPGAEGQQEKAQRCDYPEVVGKCIYYMWVYLPGRALGDRIKEHLKAPSLPSTITAVPQDIPSTHNASISYTRKHKGLPGT